MVKEKRFTSTVEDSDEIRALLKIIMENRGNVLHVPMISMRSYETNLYDLTCDGNFNRLASVWLNVVKAHNKLKLLAHPYINIVLPDRSQVTQSSNDIIDKLVDQGDGYITVYRNAAFPSGGPKQERSLRGSADFAATVLNLARYCDASIVIYEAEYVGAYLEISKLKYQSAKANNYKYKTVFWCPVSKTNNISPDFLEHVEHIDLELASMCDWLMVATHSQLEYFYEKTPKRDHSFIIVMGILIDPSLEMFSYEEDKDITKMINDLHDDGKLVIYFPFRLTDPGYRFEYLMHLLEIIHERPIVFLYTDPNDSQKAEAYDIKRRQICELTAQIEFKKLESKRDVYYTCISNHNCIIPYLEDVTEILHASWQEMQYFSSTLVTYEPSISKMIRNIREADNSTR